jgi:curved DNA-binding protein CbpA
MYLRRRMFLKDYYKILEIESSATLPEIKKAYRKLAQQYHPDKAADNVHAAAMFTEIKEAYEVLTNPGKKHTYLQQRWYNRATGNNKTQQLITPVNILKQSLEFEQYTFRLDVFRMDKEEIYEFIDKLLTVETVDKILHFNEPDINQQIIFTLLKPVKYLTLERAVLLKDRLLQLAATNTETEALINDTMRQIQKKEQWKKMEWIFILLLTTAICWLIWYAAN